MHVLQTALSLVRRLSFQSATSIALHPPSGRLCYTSVGVAGRKNQAQVDCAWMDGRNKAVLWRKAVFPFSLVFSDDGSVIYWADTGEETQPPALDGLPLPRFTWLFVLQVRA